MFVILTVRNVPHLKRRNINGGLVFPKFSNVGCNIELCSLGGVEYTQNLQIRHSGFFPLLHLQGNFSVRHITTLCLFSINVHGHKGSSVYRTNWRLWDLKF